MNEEELLKMMKDLKSSLVFFKPRCEQLQQQQSKMRDPERTMVCDILANGKLLYPDLAGDRYSLNPEKCPETCIYKRFSANMRNAAEHDKTVRNEILPSDAELKALKMAVSFAIQSRIEGYEIADNYYHKLKDLRSQP